MYTIIYLNLSFIYIGAFLYSNSFLSFFHPFLTFQRKMKEKIGWLFQTLLKGLQIYVYSRNCLYLGYTIHIWIFKDLILVKRKKRTTIFFCLQSLRVFLLFKIGNVKKDGHRGGVREMSICRIATASVNI